MNAHETNTLSRTLLSIARAGAEKAAPEFTTKLSYAEQEALGQSDHAKLLRYFDWLFAFNAPTAARRVMQELQGNRDHDTEYERDRT